MPLCPRDVLLGHLVTFFNRNSVRVEQSIFNRIRLEGSDIFILQSTVIISNELKLWHISSLYFKIQSVIIIIIFSSQRDRIESVLFLN